MGLDRSSNCDTVDWQQKQGAGVAPDGQPHGEPWSHRGHRSSPSHATDHQPAGEQTGERSEQRAQPVEAGGRPLLEGPEHERVEGLLGRERAAVEENPADEAIADDAWLKDELANRAYFEPAIGADERARRYAGWCDAVERSLNLAPQQGE